MNLHVPLALPVTQGAKDGGFNSNALYDATDTSVATLYGLPQSMKLDDLRQAVERGDFNGAWTEGAARADYFVRALNAFPVLLQAVLAAQAALAKSAPPAQWESHVKAEQAVTAALAAAGIGETKDKRWGWSAEGDKLFTSLGVFQLIAAPDNQVGAAKAARYIADAVTVIHALGGDGL